MSNVSMSAIAKFPAQVLKSHDCAFSERVGVLNGLVSGLGYSIRLDGFDPVYTTRTDGVAPTVEGCLFAQHRAHHGFIIGIWHFCLIDLID